MLGFTAIFQAAFKSVIAFKLIYTLFEEKLSIIHIPQWRFPSEIFFRDLVSSVTFYLIWWLSTFFQNLDKMKIFEAHFSNPYLLHHWHARIPSSQYGFYL